MSGRRGEEGERARETEGKRGEWEKGKAGDVQREIWKRRDGVRIEKGRGERERGG